MDEAEHSVLGDMVKEAMAAAAATLSRLVDQKVRVDLHLLEVLPPRRAAERLVAAVSGETAVAVRQAFCGGLDGEMLLVAAEDKSLDMVRQMMHDHVPLTLFTELEQDAFLEVGNVLCNACLGSVTHHLSLPVESALPAFVRGAAADILAVRDGDGPHGWESAVLARVDMVLRREYLPCCLILMLDQATSSRFSQAVARYANPRPVSC